MINSYIIEDEKLAVDKLKLYIDRHPNLQLAESFSSIEEFHGELVQPAVLFLDINLPGVSGLEFASSISGLGTQFIFVTALAEHALKGFDLDAVDYLLKPYSYARFQEAIVKVELRLNNHSQQATSIQIIKDGQKVFRVRIEEIYFIEGYKEYVRWHTDQGKIVELNSLKKIITKLKSKGFLQVHKSYLVNKQKISAFDNRQVFIQGQSIPIGRTFKPETIERLMKD